MKSVVAYATLLELPLKSAVGTDAPNNDERLPFDPERLCAVEATVGSIEIQNKLNQLIATKKRLAQLQEAVKKLETDKYLLGGRMASLSGDGGSQAAANGGRSSNLPPMFPAETAVDKVGPYVRFTYKLRDASSF
ncbi:unnamed protein product [Soboliphyme baturini]|uniref:PKcGMP_CC domain-containing protein n=1 Tax=Soboliphyme baturini TaxID=241478 RepID=A0A183J597_9BILA|nr:unnamed protein product [Soboliphyme baturini]